MLKNERKAISEEKIITTESNVRFLIFESIINDSKARFSEIFYDLGRVIYKRRELEYKKEMQISNNLSTGICEGRKYFAHDQRVDRNCYFGYIMDIPKENLDIMCRVVVYDRSNVGLQTRTIKNVESIEVVKDVLDTYIITADSKIYVVKYLKAKNITLAIADYDTIPMIGKKYFLSKLDFTGKQPFEICKLTSKIISVKEENSVYICETEKTRYIILKERKNNRFGICSTEPCIKQKMKCSSIEFNGIKPYFTQFITGMVTNIKRIGHILIVQTNSNTYYMETSLVA